jgi:heptosyltransferase-2
MREAGTSGLSLEPECHHFRGDLPCRYHKAEGARCRCAHYRPRSRRVLLIKLGALGDVIRTTPLLRRLKADDPDCEVTWVTRTPALLPALVDVPLPLDVGTALRLQADRFDAVWNLDKDPEACALAMLVPAAEKRGFGWHRGRCVPLDEAAWPKYLTGLDDPLNRANPRSYPAEIFGMVGLEFRGERYVLDRPAPGPPLPELPRPVVGLNTGCGARWPSRLWPEAHWTGLASALRAEGFTVLLLGGSDEDGRNRQIAARTGATYWGTFPIADFIHVVDRCDLVVTGVTMALHVALGLEKRVVLLNNIFNPREFELYGLGEIVEPPAPCACYFAPTCRAAVPCLATLGPEAVLAAVGRNLPGRRPPATPRRPASAIAAGPPRPVAVRP